MADITQEIAVRVNQLREDIKRNLADKKINASGKTSASLQVIVSDTGVKLVLAKSEHAPAETLEVGRPGGKVPAGFRHIIYQWSLDKGLSFNSEGERNSFAYLTARKIARQGTGRHIIPVDVYSTLVAQAVEDIKKLVTIQVINTIKQNF